MAHDKYALSLQIKEQKERVRKAIEERRQALLKRFAQITFACYIGLILGFSLIEQGFTAIAVYGSGGAALFGSLLFGLAYRRSFPWRLYAGYACAHLGFILLAGWFAFHIDGTLHLAAFMILSVALYAPVLINTLWHPGVLIVSGAILLLTLLLPVFPPHTELSLMALVCSLLLWLIALLLQRQKQKAMEEMVKAHLIFQSVQQRLFEKEQALEKQSSRLRAILDTPQDISVWVVDRHYRLIECNEAFRLALSAYYGVEVVPGIELLSLPRDKQESEKWKAYYDRALQGQTHTVYESYNRQYTEITFRPVYEGKEVTGVVVFSKDITTIKESERLLQTIIESTQDGLMVLDTQGRYLLFNQRHKERMQALLGVTPAVGHSFFALLPAQSQERERFKQLMETVLQGHHLRVEMRLSWNQKVSVEVSANPLLNEAGKVMGVAVFIRDITEDKNRQELLQSINEHLQEGIYRTTLEGDILYANQALAQLLGFDSVEALRERKVQEFFANPGAARQVIKEILNTGRVSNAELLFKRKDGSTFWALLNASFHRDTDGQVIFDGSMHDISLLKEIQEKLIVQNEELKKINAELDRFVYSASHDLKAPLASIQGIVQVARLEKDKNEVYQYLDMIERSTIRLERFVKEIIQYSRNTRTRVEPAPVDFRQLIEEVFEDMRYLPQSQHIEKIIEVEEKAPFYSDVRRLNIILNNLISNALSYYNPYEPHPYVRLLVRADAQEAVIRCEDNGLGIAPEHQDKIFRMFYRASTDSKGSGLGLYIVKEAVDKLQGSIELQSTLGKGTTFIVKIPNLANQTGKVKPHEDRRVS
ncbi:PAS domain S-box protein [Thermonema rossianum]|uniref:PAS domain S-box protein n=1 Tax=Thermonema rossianum TaxID=55505 RepID=UPI00068E548C|nr:PAS domain S-box protein [Thermonema rossianum]